MSLHSLAISSHLLDHLSIWARQQSTSTGGSASSIYPQESNLFQIDARHRLDANTAVDHGRIFISISSNGLSNHIYDAQRVEVSDSDVFLRVKFMSSSPMTFYAVRQIKIASQATSLKFPLILMQPYAAPNSPLFSGDSRGVSSSSAGIADFSCTEVDTSSSDGSSPLQLAAHRQHFLTHQQAAALFCWPCQATVSIPLHSCIRFIRPEMICPSLRHPLRLIVQLIAHKHAATITRMAFGVSTQHLPTSLILQPEEVP